MIPRPAAGPRVAIGIGSGAFLAHQSRYSAPTQHCGPRGPIGPIRSSVGRTEPVASGGGTAVVAAGGAATTGPLGIAITADPPGAPPEKNGFPVDAAAPAGGPIGAGSPTRANPAGAWPWAGPTRAAVSTAAAASARGGISVVLRDRDPGRDSFALGPVASTRAGQSQGDQRRWGATTGRARRRRAELWDKVRRERLRN